MGLFKNIGDALESTSSIFNVITSVLPDESDRQFDSIKEAYIEETSAAVDKVGAVPGARSIFNPWKVFRYSKFGQNQNEYKYDFHLDSSMNDIRGPENKEKNPSETILGASLNGIENKAVSTIKNALRPFVESAKIIENPTASRIIEWSKARAKYKQQHPGGGSPTPYTAADFLWCKYYGKIPNNRLVTLRRYPIPVEDNILIAEERSPLVPLAQAVTWYGKDISNNLNDILNLDWGFKWTLINSEVTDVTGNEVSVEDIIKIIKPNASGAERGALTDILKTQIFSGGDKIDLLKISGYDESLQEYIRQAYGPSGPYWNRILGPVNVIDKTLIRGRGFKDQNDIKITFEYSLRSYGGVNPKIAFLDLLSNFLSLTHNTAPFWGGGIRYFQRTGVTVPGLRMEEYFLKGETEEGMAEGLKQLEEIALGNIERLEKLLRGIAKEIDGKNEDELKALAESSGKKADEVDQQNVKAFQADAVQKFMSTRLGSVLKKPLMYRAFLDGRAVGEWHLTIGNPMNPMAMIGNLCLDNVKMEIGETLGLDDFPTEYKFHISLKHGKPRSKQEIESIFNLGNGQMGFSELSQPSSASNSYGDKNTFKLNESTGSDQIPGSTSAKFNESISAEQNKSNDPLADKKQAAMINSLIDNYSGRVAKMYGGEFVNRETMASYFKNLKTKD